MNALEKDIQEIAMEYCKDYPDIENCGFHEKLYAIRATLQGTILANKDCHSVIEKLRIETGKTKEQIADMFPKF